MYVRVLDWVVVRGVCIFVPGSQRSHYARRFSLTFVSTVAIHAFPIGKPFRGGQKNT